MQLREGDPVVLIEDSQLTNSSTQNGILAGQIGFDSGQVYGKPKLTITNSTISGHYQGGIAMNSGGSLTINGGSVTGNGVGSPKRGGVLLEGAFPYSVVMRGVSVTNNEAFGVSLAGDAASSFDLGTLASAGNNTFSSNTAPNLRVQVAAAKVVHAVGNIWTASAQGAEAAGTYTVSGAHCANANPCDFKTSAGTTTNYAFVSAGTDATLRLAQQ
jgi:hypothetical protein